MQAITDPTKIEYLLTRRIQDILPDKTNLEKLLLTGQPIKLYQGFDPTGSRLHLGHTIGMRNLQAFAELGHKVIVLFGTGTVLVGDPSQRDTGRKLITPEEIDANIQSWKSQVSKIIDFDRVELKQNSDWLVPLTLKDIINIASNLTAVQLFKRESFTRRLDRGDTVWFHETFYPMLQGYDSVVLDVDLELGGTDQTFNMLVGRELQRKINNREKFVATNPMIVGTDGQQMSKSSGNCIWLDDSAEDMYGKTMSIKDDQIYDYWRLLTDLPMHTSDEILRDPLQNKKQLAFDIARQFHGSAQALAAQHHFESTIQSKVLPEDVPQIDLPATGTSLTLTDLLPHQDSRSNQKRLIQQGGFEINQQKITDPNQLIELHEGDILRYGKRNYYRAKLKC